MRSREQRLQGRIDARHLGDEAEVSPAAAGPRCVEAGGGLLGARVEADRARRRVETSYTSSIRRSAMQLRQIQPHRFESPLQAGTVQQDVRPGIELQAAGLERGREPAGLRPRLQHQGREPRAPGASRP